MANNHLVQSALFGPDADEDLEFDYADLLPAANKIMDMGANYLAKSGKKFDDDTMLGWRGEVLSDTTTIARQVIKLGAQINWILRNPHQHLANRRQARRIGTGGHPVSNPSKDKGTRFETAVVDYLRWALGDDRVHRLTLHGSKDVGDIGGIYHRGARVTVECKATRAPHYRRHWAECLGQQ